MSEAWLILVISLPWPCDMFYMWGKLAPGLHVLYSWQHACWFSVPMAACSAFCHVLFLLYIHSLLFLLLSLISLLFLSLSLPLVRSSFSRVACNYLKNNNSPQHLSLVICCPSLSQPKPYLSLCRHVCFNLTKGAGQKNEKKCSRHHRNIQPYQRDLLCAKTWHWVTEGYRWAKADVRRDHS